MSGGIDMTQLDLDIIVRIIREGAPVLADSLIKSLDSFIKEKLELANRVRELESKESEQKESVSTSKAK